MKKFFLLLVLLSFMNNVYSNYDSLFRINECNFFADLKNIDSNEIAFNELLKQQDKRLEYIRRLDYYVNIIEGYKIYPLNYEDLLAPDACSDNILKFTKLYEDNNFKDYQLIRKSIQEQDTIHIQKILFKLIGLDQKLYDSVEFYLSEIRYSYTIDLIMNSANELYKLDPYTNKSIYPRISAGKNIDLISKQINKIDRIEYVHYESYFSESDNLKGFEFQHDNDVLTPFQRVNQDRELTGAFKFVFITDNFKWRFFKIEPVNSNNIFSYQTISIVGAGYTPYIRYRNNTNLADTMHNFDRPFSSFFVIERAKHRLGKKGLFRHRGEFQIGAIGIAAGRKIQAKLHEDVITKSQFVYGWDKQIGNGGRFVMQLNHKFDFLIASDKNDYFSIFKPNTKKLYNKNNYGTLGKYAGLNLIGESEFRLGTIMTTAGLGIRFSTLDLTKQSGNNFIKTKPNSRFEFGWKIDCGFNYRYVFHNSLLEGLGLFRTFDEDPYDKVSKDPIVIAENNVVRNLFIFDLGFNLRWRKTTFFARLNFHNLEYKSNLENVNFYDPNITAKIDTQDLQHYNDVIVKEQKDFVNRKAFGMTYYKYGTLGLSWLID